MRLVYRKDNGKILRLITKDIDPLVFYDSYDENFKINLEWMDYEGGLNDLKHCYVDKGVLVKRTLEEINPYDINNEKEESIRISKMLLSKYLEDNPLLFSDGKYYSVTQEKQNLLNNAITVYQMKTQLGLPAELKWNSTGEECTEWTLENIVILTLSVAAYVEPLVAKQQSLEVQIKNCITREELESIVIDYATV